MESINAVKQFVIELLNLFPEKKTDYAHIGKAYYYANRFALEDYSTLISTHRCVKLDYGPGIDDYKEIFSDLKRDGAVSTLKDIGGIPYLKLELTDIRYTTFRMEIIESIKKAFLQVKDKSFDNLTQETHALKSYEKAYLYSSIDYLDDIITDDEVEAAKEFHNSIPRFA